MSSSGSKKSTSKAPRKNARLFAIQALYQWDITGTLVNELQARARMDNSKKPTDWPFFDELLRGTAQHAEDLDEMYKSLIDRPFDQITPIEKSILRLGCYELAHCMETPFQVVIQEAIILANIFGAEESFKYINSILDQVAQAVRVHEVKETNNDD